MKHLSSIVLAVAVACHGAPADPAPGQTLPHLDRRPLAKAPHSAEKSAAENRLRNQVPGVVIERHPLLDSPRWISTREGFLSARPGPAKAVDPHGIVKSFVKEHAALFGHGSAALDDANITRDYTTAHNGLRTMVWQQKHADIPVLDAIFKAHVTRDGELVNVASEFIPNPAAAAKPKPTSVLDARQAIRNACTNLGEALMPVSTFSAQSAADGPAQRQRFRAPMLKGDADARLVWLPLNANELRLCWDVILTPRSSSAMYRIIVDATTGETWIRRCLTSDLSNASYRVFTGDSPTPLSPGYSAPGNASQPAGVARALITTKAFDAAASPEGWIPDGGNETVGNNVDAHTDLDDDEEPDLPRPQGSPSRVFDFSLDLTQGPSTYKKAAVVNLFYWCNWIHDRLYQLGFTEAAGNFQNDNFGNGGEDGDRVLADAQDGGGTNNANFATPPDGLSGRMQMYIWPSATPDRDGDFDTEVMIHEYVHGLSGRLVGGGVGLSKLQSDGLGEGWSDFYALALLSQSGDSLAGNYAMAAYVKKGYVTKNGATYDSAGDNYYFGIRRYPYSTNLLKNPLTFRDIDPTQDDSHEGVPRSPIVGSSSSEVHNVGEVWCVMLWEARAKLINKHGFATGNELILQLVTDGMKLSPANPTFVEARDAILQADQALTSGANKNELWAAFARRGLGVGAIAPPNNSTTGVLEDFAVPDGLRVLPLTEVKISGAYGGPFSFAPTNYALSNASAATLTWSAAAPAPLAVSGSSGSLAVNAKQTVTVNLNAAQAASLPTGLHERFVTFSNKVTQVVQKRRFTFTVTDPLEFNVDYPGAYESIEGPVGGPFSDGESLPLTIENKSVLNMTWVALVPPLLTVSPSGGTLAAGGEVEFELSGSTEAAALPIGAYTNLLVISNITTGAVLSRPVVVRVRNDSYFTEQFTSYDRPLDLAGKSITFLPNGSEEFYVVCVTSAANYPTDPSGGTQLGHGVYSFDNFAEVLLSGGKKASLFGQQTNRVWVHADGSITLNGPDTYNTSHWQRMRVSGLRGDYADDASLDLGARVSWKQLPDRFAATWEKLMTYPGDEGDPPKNFQIELFFDGGVRITVLSGSESGIQTIGLSRGTNYPPDFTSTDFSTKPNCADVLPPLHLSAPPPVTEGQGVLFGQGRVSVPGPVASALTVMLSSSDTTEITVPASVIIPAGATSAVFNLTVVNDVILDGTKTAIITASAQFFDSGKHIMTVHDNETTVLHLNLPLFIGEGTTASGRVWTEAAPAGNVTVFLGSTTNGAALSVPILAFIPAGATSTVFQYKTKDDSLITGTRYATITASVTNWTSATSGMLITDNEPANLTVIVPFFLSEGDDIVTNAGEVRISGPLPTNLTVNLSVSGGGLFEMIAFGPVTIPAGQTNTHFNLFVADDSLIEGIELFQIIASAAGFSNGVSGTFVLDNDGPPEPFDPSPPHLAEEVSLGANLSWAKTDGELLINGGFEDATLGGWTTFDSGGGSWVSANNSYNPSGPGGIQTPLTGSRFALSQQFGNGRHELWQEVAIPEGVSNVVLKWAHRLKNFAPLWTSNQQFRIEVRDTANHPLATVFSTQPGDPLAGDWTNRTVNLNPYKGRTIRVAFVETDELGTLQVSVDDVRVFATPSAPTTWLVYFGINPTPDGTGFLGSTTNTSVTLAPLPPGTTFYWYVKSVRGGATNSGPVWQFTTTDTTNLAPSVVMHHPGNLAVFTYPVVVTNSLNALNDDGVVSKVEFWADGVKLGEDFSSPHSHLWTNPPIGSHRLWSVAQDGFGARGTSAVQRISIIPPSGMLQTLVPFGSDWSYYDGGADLGAAWRSNTFSAGQWPSGPAKLGYGEGDEATEVNYGDDPAHKHVTTYFRQVFGSPPGIQSLQFRVRRDDGVAVFLNGREALRHNLSAAADYSTFALTELNGLNEAALAVTNVSSTNFGFRGANVIAAEVHQATASSLDLSFDLELAAVVNPKPTVVLTSPSSGALFLAPTTVTLNATASDAYGLVSNVVFFADGLALATSSVAPHTLVWSNAPAGWHWLHATVTDTEGGTNFSSGVAIQIVAPPNIITQPANRIAYAGSTVSFFVGATGSPPLLYQWRLGNTPITGATNATLTLSNVQSAHAGDYVVSVSNEGGLLDSTTATLVVRSLPRLEINYGSFRVVLAWPEDEGEFNAESTTNLVPPVVWEPVLAGASQQNGKWMIVLPVEPIPQRFFRLRTP